MKKNMQKRLNLNKITVSNLDEGSMENAKGGVIPTFVGLCWTDFTCASCERTSCGCEDDTQP